MARPHSGVPSLVVVTFATEGHPHDEGEDLRDTILELRSLLEAAGVKLIVYTPRLLCDDPYYQRHCMPVVPSEEEPGMELLPRACKLGYYAWKPLVICKALEQLPEGGMLLFMDANIRKYPQYRKRIEDLPSTCASLLDKCGSDIFVPLEDAFWKRIRNHCKKHTLELMDANTFDIAYSPALCVNRILVRRSEWVQAVMNEWLEWCAKPEVISPLPNPDPHPLSVFHTPEQAILSICLRKRKLRGELPDGWPRFSYAVEGSPDHRVYHLDAFDHWPLPLSVCLARRAHCVVFFGVMAVSCVWLSSNHALFKLMPRATPLYILRFAYRCLIMSFVPFPINC